MGGDCGPYYQTQRGDHYRAALQKLIDSGSAYPCFCSAEELEAARAAAKERGDSFQGYQRTCRDLDPQEAQRRIDAGEPHVWRLRVPDDHGPVVVNDVVHGPCTFDPKELDDMVIFRSDGTPTYNFATVVDDGEMGITHIIRGDDHLSNTPRQILVFEALGYEVPVFAHLSMILGPDGKKLSKRHGATSVEEYRDRGFLPEATVNYLALLGWSLDGETTIVPPVELCRHFSLERISKNPSQLDEEKLLSMNGTYLNAMTDAEFSQFVLVPQLAAAGMVAQDAYESRPAWFDLLSSVLKPRVRLMPEVVEKSAFLFGARSSRPSAWRSAATRSRRPWAPPWSSSGAASPCAASKPRRGSPWRRPRHNAPVRNAPSRGASGPDVPARPATGLLFVAIHGNP